ncbi:MAG: DUF4258 domain-containing protein [Candidatus Magasanikbacteria bacterium]|nr:DUF4258 domain-containing protein [Candidatus Magasanikbacteria bacterium]
MIIFTRHAEEKFALLQKHKIRITREQVISIVKQPKRLDLSRFPLFIAQGPLDQNRVIRVVYKRENDTTKIITFYPGRKKQYEI